MSTNVTPKGHATMSSAIKDAVNYHNWLLDLCRPYLGKKILELGPGYGQYTRSLAAYAGNVVAADIDEDCIAYINDNIPGATGLVAGFDDPDWTRKVGDDQSFDTIIAFNMLEHLQNPDACLTDTRRLLAPNGRLLLIVPAHPSLYGPMDKLAGHYRRYSQKGLREELSTAGYAIQKLVYFNPIGAIGWWVNARLFKPRSLSSAAINAQILFFDRWLIPLSRTLSGFTHGFFGQSIWCCATACV